MKRKLNCILLIDDDEPTNYISSMLIEEADCTEQIKIIQNGQSALDYLIRKTEFPRPDLIFLDINMPAMNGWEFLEKYNTLEQNPTGKIIMLTTSLNPDDEVKAKEVSIISGFENKPLTTEKLDRILKKYFPSYFFEPNANKRAIYSNLMEKS